MNPAETSAAAAWLDTRQPAAPAGLALRLRAVMARDDVGDGDAPSFERYLSAGERLLGELLRDGCASRDSALDLLAADALVTYAFEAAAEEPDALDARARAAMTRIAALAARANGA